MFEKCVQKSMRFGEITAVKNTVSYLNLYEPKPTWKFLLHAFCIHADMRFLLRASDQVFITCVNVRDLYTSHNKKARNRQTKN